MAPPHRSGPRPRHPEGGQPSAAAPSCTQFGAPLSDPWDSPKMYSREALPPPSGSCAFARPEVPPPSPESVTHDASVRRHYKAPPGGGALDTLELGCLVVAMSRRGPGFFCGGPHQRAEQRADRRHPSAGRGRGCDCRAPLRGDQETPGGWLTPAVRAAGRERGEGLCEGQWGWGRGE